MTLEVRTDAAGNRTLHTVRCPLCGEPLGEQTGLAQHLPDCPARPVFSERGVLQEPDHELRRRVEQTLAARDGQEETTRALADGGEGVDG